MEDNPEINCNLYDEELYNISTSHNKDPQATPVLQDETETRRDSVESLLEPQTSSKNQTHRLPAYNNSGDTFLTRNNSISSLSPTKNPPSQSYGRTYSQPLSYDQTDNTASNSGFRKAYSIDSPRYTKAEREAKVKTERGDRRDPHRSPATSKYPQVPGPSLHGGTHPHEETLSNGIYRREPMLDPVANAQSRFGFRSSNPYLSSTPKMNREGSHVRANARHFSYPGPPEPVFEFRDVRLDPLAFNGPQELPKYYSTAEHATTALGPSSEDIQHRKPLDSYASHESLRDSRQSAFAAPNNIFKNADSSQEGHILSQASNHWGYAVEGQNLSQNTYYGHELDRSYRTSQQFTDQAYSELAPANHEPSSDSERNINSRGRGDSRRRGGGSDEMFTASPRRHMHRPTVDDGTNDLEWNEESLSSRGRKRSRRTHRRGYLSRSIDDISTHSSAPFSAPTFIPGMFNEGVIGACVDDRPPGGWYWGLCMNSANSLNQLNSANSEENEMGLDDEMMENILPIQLYEPPLHDCIPVYPQALESDQQPKQRKKSKYTPEQDRLILELKNSGESWASIAKKAGCDNHLAARNRYQVLIGQQGGGAFFWTAEDCWALQSILDEGERAKWRFIAEELSKKRAQRFTFEQCHYKTCELFAKDPEVFGIIKSQDPNKGGAPYRRRPW